MISIITCSTRPEICRRMLDSVSKTIGTEYEIVVFDNREENRGICEAYNKAADTAIGDYLCFVHEDIVVKTDDWGKELIKFAERTDDCGVIGIAGGKSANRNFLGWWNVPDKLIKVYDGVDSGGSLDSETNLFYHYSNPNNELFSKAVCLDGVFLFVKKNIWENNKFDEKTFKAFHFYDADFSFSISQKYQNYVYFGMDICHFSAGDIEKTFCDNMYLFQKKWKNRLPYYLPGYKVSFRQELVIVNDMLSLYRRNVFPRREVFKRIYRINGLLFSMLFFVYFFMRSLKCRLFRQEK